MKWKFKEDKSFEERLNEALKVKTQYPNRIPVFNFKIISYLKII